MNKTIKSIPVTEEARRATGVDGMDFSSKVSSATESVVNLPDPEVSQIAKRRRFSADYKLNILRQADTCSQSGDISALLRREGLYASHLSTWRRQRNAGSLQALKPKTRGRKPAQKNPLAAENARQQREIKRLELRLKKAEIIIDVQKKVSEILGITLNSPEESDNE
jgi:transposase-like protein